MVSRSTNLFYNAILNKPRLPLPHCGCSSPSHDNLIMTPLWLFLLIFTFITNSAHGASSHTGDIIIHTEGGDDAKFGENSIMGSQKGVAEMKVDESVRCWKKLEDCEENCSTSKECETVSFADTADPNFETCLSQLSPNSLESFFYICKSDTIEQIRHGMKVWKIALITIVTISVIGGILALTAMFVFRRKRATRIYNMQNSQQQQQQRQGPMPKVPHINISKPNCSDSYDSSDIRFVRSSPKPAGDLADYSAATATTDESNNSAEANSEN